ncbi:hypothetical protein [Eubacterium sp. F2]|uniref:hypothetical protein n=1 Tax=Eubacterium sp. F2 TaxID=3381348 RepID=UPI0039082332
MKRIRNHAASPPRRKGTGPGVRGPRVEEGPILPPKKPKFFSLFRYGFSSLHVLIIQNSTFLCIKKRAFNRINFCDTHATEGEEKMNINTHEYAQFYESADELRSAIYTINKIAEDKMLWKHPSVFSGVLQNKFFQYQLEKAVMNISNIEERLNLIRERYGLGEEK